MRRNFFKNALSIHHFSSIDIFDIQHVTQFNVQKTKEIPNKLKETKSTNKVDNIKNIVLKQGITNFTVVKREITIKESDYLDYMLHVWSFI